MLTYFILLNMHFYVCMQSICILRELSMADFAHATWFAILSYHIIEEISTCRAFRSTIVLHVCNTRDLDSEVSAAFSKVFLFFSEVFLKFRKGSLSPEQKEA
jgi:hypothetical protein